MLGPGITHLSLWHSESRTLLRDAGQVQERGRDKPRIGALGPSWSWGEGEVEEDDAISDSDSDDGSDSSDGEDGERISSSRPALSPEDVAALRERARQKMPTWLRRELEKADSPAEVARRHRAHLLPFGDPDRHFAPAEAPNGAPHATDALSEHMVQESRRGRDRRRIKGCRPRCLSLMLSLPLFENQEPRLFASLMVLSRCEELDCFLPVPAHAPRLLMLLAHLRRSPLRRLKISSTHFSLVMAVPPFSRAQEREMREERQREEQPKRRRDQSGRPPRRVRPRGPNLALALRTFLENEAMRSALYWEFAGKHVDVPQALERELTSVAVRAAAKQSWGRTAQSGGQGAGPAERPSRPTAQYIAGPPFSHRPGSLAPGGVSEGRPEVNTVADADDGFPAALSALLALEDGKAAGTKEKSNVSDVEPHAQPIETQPHQPEAANGNEAHQEPTKPQAGTGLQHELPHESIRIRIFQRNQGHYGRLKDRREDFVERSMGGEGVWEKCGVWEGDNL